VLALLTVAASAILLAIPGPATLLVISYAPNHGRQAATSTVAGVALGDFTAMIASMRHSMGYWRPWLVIPSVGQLSSAR